MKYRKKPVEIEAFCYNGAFDDISDESIPDWVFAALDDGTIFHQGNELYIETLEGVHHASVGDYIIRGIKGELYPCKPDIFEKTYEPVEECN